MPLGVSIGGIDEVPTPVDIARQNGLRIGDAGSPAPVLAESPGAQTKRTDPQARPSESDLVVQRHSCSFQFTF